MTNGIVLNFDASHHVWVVLFVLEATTVLLIVRM